MTTCSIEFLARVDLDAFLKWSAELTKPNTRLSGSLQSQGLIQKIFYLKLWVCSRKEVALREAENMVRLEHPGIVRYFTAWVEEPPDGWQVRCFLCCSFFDSSRRIEWTTRCSMSGWNCPPSIHPSRTTMSLFTFQWRCFLCFFFSIECGVSCANALWMTGWRKIKTLHHAIELLSSRGSKILSPQCNTFMLRASFTAISRLLFNICD